MGKTRNIILLAVFILIIISIGGCKAKVSEKENIVEEDHIGGIQLNLEQLQMPKPGEEVAIITTNYGEIKLRLFPEIAPKAVENFKTHAVDGYYNGVTFHRVMQDFMIQGGDPQGTGRGGESIWGAPFEDEFHNDYRNFNGALSMANAGPGTNGSQFFIVQKSDIEKQTMAQLKAAVKDGLSEDIAKAYEELGGTAWLDFKHTVFGQVYEGMDVVNTIAKVKTGAGDKPVNPVVMEKIEVVEYK